MKLSFGSLVITAGIFGILSFAFLAAAIGSDYWYIKVNRTNETDTEILDSHSGLWIIYKGVCIPMRMDDFVASGRLGLFLIRHLSCSKTVVFVVLLPLSLVRLLFGGICGLICGLISSLPRSPALLTGTVSYLFFCVLTLSGVSLYISYSQQALAEAESLVGAERLAQVVSTSFELGLAWLSFCLEVLTGLLLAAHPATLQSGSPGHGWPSIK
uniref:Transmembrane protein 235 n=1 Tax=Salmo trutta TaxID=8032 RepID=A0A673W7S1_SALTR